MVGIQKKTAGEKVIAEKVRLRKLKNIYSVFILILAITATVTPYLIKEGTSYLTEESFEMIIIASIFVLNFTLSKLYEKEVITREKKLVRAWAHVGKMNLLVERFKEALLKIEKFPETKNDMKKVLEVIADRILGIIDCPYVIIRVLEAKKLRTLAECSRHRGEKKDTNNDLKISNKYLLENKVDPKHLSFYSSISNSDVKTFCILPKCTLDEENRIFIQKIINDLTILYIVFSLKDYR